MIRQLFTTIPRQGLVELARQLLSRLDQRGDDALGVLVRNFNQHHIPRMPLNKGRDIAVLRSPNQVAFPPLGHTLYALPAMVARNGTILDGCRSCADGHSILNLTITLALLACVLGAPDCAFGTQVLQKFLL